MVFVKCEIIREIYLGYTQANLFKVELILWR